MWRKFISSSVRKLQGKREWNEHSEMCVVMQPCRTVFDIIIVLLYGVMCDESAYHITGSGKH